MFVKFKMAAWWLFCFFSYFAFKCTIFIRPLQTQAYYGMALSIRSLSDLFRLTRAQVHISLQISLILSIRVYDHKTLNPGTPRPKSAYVCIKVA